MLTGLIYTIFIGLIILLNKLLVDFSFRVLVLAFLSTLGLFLFSQTFDPLQLEFTVLMVTIISVITSAMFEKNISNQWILLPLIVSLGSLPLILIITCLAYVTEKTSTKLSAGLFWLLIATAFCFWVPELQNVSVIISALVVLVLYFLSIKKIGENESYAETAVLVIILSKLIGLSSVNHLPIVIIGFLTLMMVSIVSSKKEKLITVIRSLILFSILQGFVPLILAVCLYLFVDTLRIPSLYLKRLVQVDKFDAFSLRVFNLICMFMLGCIFLEGNISSVIIFIALGIIFIWKLLRHIVKERSINILDVCQLMIVLVVGGVKWL